MRGLFNVGEHMYVFGQIQRWIVESARTSTWRKARDAYRGKHDSCELCRLKSGLEVHDIFPWYLMSDRQKNDYGWLLGNFILLDHQCHRQIGHCADQKCMAVNTHIREISAYVQSQCREWCAWPVKN